MRVEIEISEDEAAYMRKHCVKHEAVCVTTDYKVLARLTAALPRPIQVGDTVRYHEWTTRFQVLAIWSKYAWIARTNDLSEDPVSAMLAELSVVAAGAASERPA